ncbi:alanine/glycine:cation symporter family protein [Emcibacter sp.]|uniref:alanine/glycine:cation symporter family protein n=1 Tax=Emcibacter sp. TaxID=1979954 RepID=UPI002AA7EED8|nr:alanine/glycine:cation symporter family protein [Emcibacter sp.]
MFASSAHAVALDTDKIDQAINGAVAPFTDRFSAFIFYPITIAGQDLPWIVIWLATAAVGFTLYFWFINFRGFGLALRIVRGDYTKKSDAGEVSHFQALTAALSGTVGLGNIAGVGVAISLGGPGATFWMIVVGLFGMTSKFAECTLGVKYREIDENGVVSGGPMYYLKKGLAEKGFPKIGLFLAGIFAICCILGSFGAGNIFQISNSLSIIKHVTGGENSFLHNNGWIYGVTVSIFVGVVIIGGIKSIASVTSKLVPFMCGIYMLAAFGVLFSLFDQIPAAFAAIIEGAFAPEASIGGVIAVMIQGMRRATFSNEAGIGSAAIAHSAVKTDEPVTEGLVALLEPFIDTVVVCTTTALVIIITGAYLTGDSTGIVLTSNAFTTVYPSFDMALAVIAFLFAISTTITWAYYGQKSWEFLFGGGKAIGTAYKLLFCAVAIIGSTMPLGKIVDFGDAALFSMAIPNIIGVVILAPVVKREINSYLERIRSGEIAPVTAEEKA